MAPLRVAIQNKIAQGSLQNNTAQSSNTKPPAVTKQQLNEVK